MAIEATRTKHTVLEKATKEFLRTGIAWHREPTTIVLPSKLNTDLGAPTTRMALRELAKKNKRPFLFAASEWHRLDDHQEVLVTILTVPKLTKLQQVVSVLLIGSEEGSSRRYQQGSAKPLSKWHNKTNNYFQFTGPEGHEIFESFIEHCATDPATRILLNNTTPVTPRVIALAA